MNKAVLLSIKPKYCELIASGEKTVEVRKTRPKIDVPFKCYIYMTKAHDTIFGKGQPKRVCIGGGEVIGEFVCDRITRFKVFEDDTVQFWNFAELKKSCLTYEQVAEYIGRNKFGYAWRISDLVIYDKPKELSEFKPICRWMNDDFSCMYRKVGCSKVKFDMNPDNTVNLATCTKRLSKAPQSWCYVEDSEVE